MSSSRQDLTYIMFTKRGRGFGKIVGPFFETEKDIIRKECFGSNKKVHIVEETAFESRYPYHYKQHVQIQFMDKLLCYFNLNASWIGKTYFQLSESSVTSDWFGLFVYYDAEIDTNIHLLNLSISANPFHVARLRQDLSDMALMPIALGEKYYYDAEGRLFTGNNAYSRYLANNLIAGMSLT